MGTITLRVDDALQERFRRIARSRFGNEKGALKKGYTEAITAWLGETDVKSITQRQLSWAKRTWGTGGRLYKTREELYD